MEKSGAVEWRNEEWTGQKAPGQAGHPHRVFALKRRTTDPRITAPRSFLYCGDVSRAVRKSKLYTAKVTSNSPVECDYVIETSALCLCLLDMYKSGRLGLPLRMGNVQFLTLYWLSGEQVDEICVGTTNDKHSDLLISQQTTLTNGSLRSVGRSVKTSTQITFCDICRHAKKLGWSTIVKSFAFCLNFVLKQKRK